jgi:transposase
LADHRRGKRRSYSKAFKRRVVVETFVPGASVASVARQHGLNANMVFAWRRDPRFGPGRDAATFLPVEVTSGPVASDPVTSGEVRPAEIARAPEAIVPASDSWIEITLASGHRLRLGGGFDVDAVVRLAQGLEQGLASR